MAVKIKFSFSILLFIEAQKPAVQELAFHGLQQRQGWRIVVDQFSGHSHEWCSLGNPAGQSILPLSHQETHFVGAVAHLFGLTSTRQMGLSC